MSIPILAFVSLAALVSWLPVLPPPYFLAWGVPIGVAGLWYRGVARVAGAGLLGFAYAALVAHARLEARLPEALAGTDLEVQGRIVSLPRYDNGAVRFRLQLADCPACWTNGVVALSWYYDGRAPQVTPGERWAMTARLERPRGSINPGIFDYEGWLFTEGIVATGYVRGTPRRLDAAGWHELHHQLRQALAARIHATLQDFPVAGLITALAIGAHDEIGPRAWRVLSDTGTNHLLIISGLHVGLIATASYRCLTLILGWLAPTRMLWASPGALALATLYGALAGMGLPVQRALVMTMVALAGLACRRQVTMSTLLCIALLLVTVIDPFAAFRTGFWLSFGAVFVLVFCFGARTTGSGESRLYQAARIAVRSQWVVLIGMLPVLLATVGQVAWLAWLVNLVAIPWVSLLVIPALLLAMVLIFPLPAAGVLLLKIAAFALMAIWHWMRAVADIGLVHYLCAPVAPVAFALAASGGLLVISPAGLLPRWVGLPMLLPLVLARVQLYPDELDVRVMDVGQGLSVLVRTASQTLLYDAGPRFGDRFDAGERIVTPALRHAGVTRRVSRFVVSHSDNDHAGGAAAILRAFLVLDVSSDVPIRAARQPCRDGETTTGAMSLAFFRAGGSGATRNDRSCVVLVRFNDFSLLLPGDIEVAGERHLLDSGIGRVNVIIAPHHGSRTSSTPALLNRVRPDVAIFSSGFHNRFGHPDPGVVRRYAGRGARLFNTAMDGAIHLRVRGTRIVQVETARRSEPRFWYDRALVR
ncbi:MAG: DNA internalization-related competence protein ComEC/Rec2 [Pseudomonadales bacterium]|nr:DNA internalization-related competence protein ComEC/Rec2 [Pseudomonadales bacterium]